MNINKRKLRKIMYVFIILLTVLVFASKTVYNMSSPKVTVAVTDSGYLYKAIEAQGVMAFAESHNVYAEASGQIDSVHITERDVINSGTVLLSLKEEPVKPDYSVERIKNRLTALELDKTGIQEKLNGLKSSDSLLDFQRAATDAQAVLENRRKELTEAKFNITVAFDDYEYRQKIDDAEREKERTKAKLDELLSEQTEPFDDLLYQRSIQDASIILERKLVDLAEVEESLETAKKSSKPFDSYLYQRAIDDV